jgi:methylase of polypeptide subunit release factors
VNASPQARNAIPALSSRSLAALAELRSGLDGAGFRPDRLRALLGADSMFAYHARHKPLAALRGERPLSVFVELLLAGRRVELPALRRVLSEETVAGLAECGVLRVDGDEVSSAVAIEPLDDVLLVGDVPTLGEPELEYAAPSSPSSLQLARLTVRRDVERTLDLGTGAGLQAVLAAGHSRHVLGVDLNRHALGHAALALALNGRTNVELREGSWFEPVEEDARFDLIVSNPPFLAAPDVTWWYAHSEQPYELSRRLVRDAAQRLVEGGLAHVMCAWGLRTGDDSMAVPRGWVDGLGCDALVFCFETSSALDYATGEHRHLLGADRDEFDARVDRFLEYLDGLGTDEIAFGLVVLRRRHAAENWARGVPSAGPSGGAGPQVERMLAGGDLLMSRPNNDELLDTAYRPAPGLAFVRRWQADDSQPPARVEVHAQAGVSVHVDPTVADALTASDGSLTLGELVEFLAADSGRDPSALRSSAASSARELLAMGLLVPERPAWAGA